MQQAHIVEFPLDRNAGQKTAPRDRINQWKKKGRVYGRQGKLWVDFRYRDHRVREPSGMKDTPANQKLLRKKLDLVLAEIDNGTFAFAKRFPYSRKREFFASLEGREVKVNPRDVRFGEYYKKWWQEMAPGMSVSQVRDYLCTLNNHLLPYFRDLPFSEFNQVQMKKFLSFLKSKRFADGKALSAKRISNIFIPLRVITKDALQEYGWNELSYPFAGLKLPKGSRMRISPFSYQEWKVLMSYIPSWYRLYFEFAVQTGLRPSEQVAIKWSSVDSQFIYIEASRVRNVEKSSLKTEGSQRCIAIRPVMATLLERQRELAAGFESPYVFVNMQGRPILQDKLREMWERVMKKSGLPYRRMYETRHTFASWALAAGESPEWVARTLGHVNTSMVFKTYGRYIPNLTRRDGSAFERQFHSEVLGNGDGEGSNLGTILGTIADFRPEHQN
ncbi:MAG: Arm DNA-binding domain-containing protein [Syntrophales bacterium]